MYRLSVSVCTCMSCMCKYAYVSVCMRVYVCMNVQDITLRN